jgi:hypothetical protein
MTVTDWFAALILKTWFDPYVMAYTFPAVSSTIDWALVIEEPFGNSGVATPGATDA